MDIDEIAEGLSEAEKAAFFSVGRNQPDGTAHLLNEYSRSDDVKAWGLIEKAGCATAHVHWGSGVAYQFNERGLAIRAHLENSK